MTPANVRLGTRKSKLALWQTDHVSGLLRAAHPGTACEAVHFTTAGDRLLDRPIPEVGDKGAFTAELEAALRDGAVDAAVHSLKDLPTEMGEGLAIGATPERADPRDAFVSANYRSLDQLPEGARVGTSSTRRTAQLRACRPDLVIEPIRGNVDTRVRKALDGRYDAVLLAVAGLERLGLSDVIRERLATDVILPAPGQGAVAVQCRDDDEKVLGLLGTIDHAATRAAVTAERSFLAAVGGGCATPVGALAESEGPGKLRLTAVIASPSGDKVVRVALVGDAADPAGLGREAAARALAGGGRELLE